MRNYLRLALVALWAGVGFGQVTRTDSVVVTGVYEPVATDEADRAVRTIPATDEQRVLTHTVIDFLNRDSSVDLRQRGQNNIQTDVSIRGSTFGQTLVLLDGVRLNDVQSGHHNMDVPVPVESLERIEILKGSGSTQYGSDAIGGVVHFVTRDPEHSEVRLRTGIGSFGSNQQRVAASYTRNGFSQQLFAARDFSTGFIENRDYRNLALTSITGFRTRAGDTRITLAHADKPFGAEQFYGNFNSWERTKTWWSSLRHRFDERTNASFTFRRHTDLFVLYRDRPQVFTNRHAVESFQAAFRRWEPVTRNARLHWGVEGLRDAITSTNLGNHTRARGAAYAAFDMRALKRFSLSLGAREEMYGSANHQFSPTAAVGAWIAPTLKIRGSVTRAFRLPTFTDLYYHDPANQGTPDLRPESATSVEAGLDWHATSRVRAEAAVFQRRERDGIDFVRRSPADIWRATNFQKLRFTGVEASARVRAREAHVIDFSYTGLRGVQDAVQGLFSRYSFNYPQHLGVAGWQGTLPGGIAARARVGAVQRYARDAYAVVDVYAARVRGRVHPFVQLTNLNDAVYQEIFGVAMPGRAVMVGVEMRVFGR
ncbi:MAG: TonB-dependent receptor [Bryobacteraceae bacterium]